MSDTPETDLAIKAGGGDWSPVLRVTSQRLERQRDEAMDIGEKLSKQGLEMMDENRTLKRERDEARADLEFRRGLYKVQEEFLEAARRDLAEAQIECLEQARLLSMSSEREAKLIYKRDEARKIASELAIQAERLRKGRDEARELVKAYQEYTNLLGDEINDMTAVAYVHGWRTNRYEEGKVLRDKIKRLEGAK